MAKNKSGEEVFVEVPGYEGLYEISNLGRIKKIYKSGETIRKIKHKDFALSRDGTKTWFRTGKVILSLFLGPCPEGYHVVRVSDDKTDNSVSNFEYVRRQHKDKEGKGYTSKYRGVNKVSKNRYRVRFQPIGTNKKRIDLGLYPTEEEAAEIYKQAEAVGDKITNENKSELIKGLSVGKRRKESDKPKKQRKSKK